MIHFDREVWTTVCYWEGGIIREIVRPSSWYLVYLAALVIIQKSLGNLDFNIEKSSISMIMSFLVFLLVFRVNSTHSIHRSSALEVRQFFCTIESMLEVCCTSMRGPIPEDPPEVQQEHAEMVILTKVNVIRISLAYAISFVFHSAVITAVTEHQGEIDNASLQDIIFLRHRLQGLLYGSEMELVDRAICIMQEAPRPNRTRWQWPANVKAMWGGRDVEESVYRGEVSRHRPKGGIFHQFGSVLLGKEVPPVDAEADDDEHVDVIPLPKVIMPILLMALKKAVSQPWGFPERVWTIFAKYIMNMKSSLAVIDAMCATPTPLPYVQLSHILVLIFAIFYPLTIDVQGGVADTIVMPFLIYFTIQGFETLAKMLETSTGHDVTDLNFMELVHDLEVQAKHAFESTELWGKALDQGLMDSARSFNFSVRNHEKPLLDFPHLPRHFGAYFHWLPMPTLVLETLLQAHGHADVLQKAAKIRSTATLRKLLRIAMKRVHAGGVYTSLEAEPDDTQDVEETLELIRQDPKFFSHYVVFAGVHDIHRSRRSVADSTGCSSPGSKTPGYPGSHATWKSRVISMLSQHSAAGMLGGGEAASERSFLATFRDVSAPSREVSQEDEHAEARPLLGGGGGGATASTAVPAPAPQSEELPQATAAAAAAATLARAVASPPGSAASSGGVVSEAASGQRDEKAWEATSRPTSARRGEEGQEAAGASTKQILRQLPGGWLECRDELGIFYYNQLTQQTSEAPPPALSPKSAAQAPAPVTRLQIGAWRVLEDAQGEFYFNQETGQSYNQPPSELVALVQAKRAATGGGTPPSPAGSSAAAPGPLAPPPRRPLGPGL